MRTFDVDRRAKLKLAAIAGAVLLFFVFYIDDWGRDFTAHEAALSAQADDELLRTLVVTRSAQEMIAAVKMAARRVRNWEYAGEASDGSTALLYFVRQNRLLRIRDDVVVKIEDMGDSRVVHATSRARLHVGDLGRNPRNLRRFMSELRTVLDGSAHGAALEWTGPTESR
jgi:uncharacterized protein (DUF1499 family)